MVPCKVACADVSAAFAVSFPSAIGPIAAIRPDEMKFQRHARLPDHYNSTLTARWRYIQSIHEPVNFRNPDKLAGHFIPTLDRWHCRWLGRRRLAELRAAPFYYYLVARTKHYDNLFLDAIARGAKQIINVGCGQDTRAHRFVDILKRQGIKILECDLPEAIVAKRRIVNQFGLADHVEYLSLDLNGGRWQALEQKLAKAQGESLIFMEGVSPYVEESAFKDFLLLLAMRLRANSWVAYDFKFRGFQDDLGRVGRTQKPFRLLAAREDLIAFHSRHGHRLKYFERSSELSARLMPQLMDLGFDLFDEDGLVQLMIDGE
jgi:methyltransferase (TIGR00027 family)